MASSATTGNGDLSQLLRELGLRRAAEGLSDLIAAATRSRWSPAQLLEELARAEKEDRAARSVQRRLSGSKLGSFKPMADFEWDWPKQIDRAAVERVLSLSFLERAENVILAAGGGLGKTMIAKNIAHQAILAGKSVLFVLLADMLLDLGKQESSFALDRKLRRYASVPLLVIDEIGYVTYDNRATDLLFQVVNRRYEKKPTIVTSNLKFSEWRTLFPNASAATALVERLIHRSEVIAIDGESYRKREAELAAKARREKARQ